MSVSAALTRYEVRVTDDLGRSHFFHIDAHEVDTAMLIAIGRLPEGRTLAAVDAFMIRRRAKYKWHVRYETYPGVMKWIEVNAMCDDADQVKHHVRDVDASNVKEVLPWFETVNVSGYLGQTKPEEKE